MKKITYFVASVFVASFLFSCNNSATEQVETNEVEAVEHEDYGEEAEHSDAIVLIDGEKWEVNEEMKPFIKNGENLVENFRQNPSPTISDYQVLAMQIKTQNDKLIKSCTMQGQSHDELHKWLHPHLDMVKQLTATSDLMAAQQIVLRLSNSYAEFGKYFK